LSSTPNKKCFGRIFTIHAPKNKELAVKETHFGSYPLARFTKIIPGSFLRFTRPKTKLFAVKFRQISEVFFMGAFS